MAGTVQHKGDAGGRVAQDRRRYPEQCLGLVLASISMYYIQCCTKGSNVYNTFLCSYLVVNEPCIPVSVPLTTSTATDSSRLYEYE